MSFGGPASLGPAKELKRSPPDSLAVAGGRCENKGRRKRRREGGKKNKGKGSRAPTKFFMSISPVRSFSSQFA